MTDGLGAGRSGLAALSSILSLGYAVFALSLGGILDRNGPRGLMLASVVSLSVGSLLVSQVQTLWQLYLVWIVLVVFGFYGLNLSPMIALIQTVSSPSKK